MTGDSQRVSRMDIVRLGQAGAPWNFLSTGLAACDAVPQDLGIRFLLAANFAQLGLPTPAREHLDAITAIQPESQSHADIVRLRTAIDALPDDRICPRHAQATAMRNFRALRATRPEVAKALAPAIEPWGARTIERFRTQDHNTLWRINNQWGPLVDQRSVARAFTERHLPASSPSGAQPLHKPVVIEGLSPPWLFESVMTCTPRIPLGHQPRVILVQSNPIDLLDGLAVTDLCVHLTDPRLHCFIGPDAGTQLERWLHTRATIQLAGLIVTTPGTHATTSPSVSQAVNTVVRVQEDEHTTLKARIDRLYADRNQSWWADRYQFAQLGNSQPIRVLIPTSVYTSFVQHAADDLARALRASGLQAQVHKELSRYDILASTATLRVIDSFQPDLVVMINHTRRVPLGGLLPDNLPVVTWIQDSMPSLFDGKLCRADGPLDFLTGHLLHTATQSLGTPPQRTLPFPVLADHIKFHSESVSASLLREHACEVSIATHQSETPEALLYQWLDQTTCPTLRSAGQAAAKTVHALIDADEPRLLHATKWAAINAVEQAFGSRDPEAIKAVRYGLALPLADRLLRHRALHWAAHLCAQRGWRLALYGKGWQNHPTLARYARGPAQHGEHLRAIYQASAAHLHISVNTLMHQRVLECALSGGLPLCMLTEAAVACIRSRAQADLLAHATPLRTDSHGVRHYATDAIPLAKAYTLAAAACGWPAEPTIWIDAPLADRFINKLSHPPAEHHDPVWLLNGLDNLGFRTIEHLEQRLERAIENPTWRVQQSAAIADRVRAHLTHTSMIQPLLDMITRSLCAQASGDSVESGESNDSSRLLVNASQAEVAA
jgi:hypothetical protein